MQEAYWPDPLKLTAKTARSFVAALGGKPCLRAHTTVLLSEDLLNAPAEIGKGKGLLQDRNSLLQRAGVGVTGDEDGWSVGFLAAHCPDQFVAPHTGHDDVSNNQRNILGIFPKNAQGLIPV